MYISIDMDNDRILHKHQDHETVSALSWLECGQHTSIRIDNTESDNFLRGVAHGNLCHLYKNTTGDDYNEANWGDRAWQFRERLREAARNMAATVALTDEVLAQVAAVDDRLHAGERFKYALGSRVPAQAQELFPLTSVPLVPPQIAAADARAAAQVEAWRAQIAAERAGETLPGYGRDPQVGDLDDATGELGNGPAPEERPVAKARAGSVQPVVFAAAKSAWEARSEGQTWNDIRAQLFVTLTGEGHHPTTVRIKLAKWAKENGI